MVSLIHDIGCVGGGSGSHSTEKDKEKTEKELLLEIKDELRDLKKQVDYISSKMWRL